MPDATISKRARRYQDNQHKKGLSQVRVWVPVDQIEMFRELAAMARYRHKHTVPLDNESINDPTHDAKEHSTP